MTAHYWIRAAILAALSWYVVHLEQADKLQWYIVPRMIPYVKYGALAMFALAGFYAFLAIRSADRHRGEPACDCGHEPPRSASGNALLYGLFFIPLLLGFALPDRIMGSDVVAVKGMNLNAASASQSRNARAEEAAPARPAESPKATPEQEAAESQPAEQPEPFEQPAERPVESSADELDRLFPEDEYGLDFAELGKRLYGRDTIRVEPLGYLELLTMLDMYKENFIGRHIEISGFVYREDDMGANEFVVSRMAMQCCSADATPYGFLVQSSMGPTLENDTWISMTGTLSTSAYRDNEIIRLEATEVRTIEPPADPYVYPYFDDFDLLAIEE